MTRSLALLTFLTSLGWSQTEISYEMLARSATEHSQSLALHKFDMQIEAAKTDTVRAEYYPSVTLGFNNEYNKDLDGSSTGVESVGDSLLTNGTRYQSSLSLGMNYELYHFGATEKKVAVSELETALKRLQWCETEQELHGKILEQYGTALKAQHEIMAKRRMLELKKEAYTQKQRLYLAGRFSKIDLGETAMAVLDLERGIEETRQRFDDAVLTLSQLSYLALDSGEVVLQPLGRGMDGFKPLAFSESVVGEQMARRIHQKEEEIAMFKRSQLPSVAFYSNYYLYGSDPASIGSAMETMGSNSWKAGIGIRVNLFEGFKYLSESERLSLELQRLKEERSLREREYDFDTRMRQNRLGTLERLEPENLRMLDETEYVAVMADRLREKEQIDAPAHLEKRVQTLQRSLEVQIKRIDASLEHAALELHYRGVDQCSLR